MLITEGASFIGSALVDTLVERGAQVRIVDNLTSGKVKNVKQHLASGAVEFVEAKANGPWFKVLGVRVNAVQIPNVIELMEKWISSRDSTHFISLTNVHSVMEAQRDASFKKTLNAADLSVPDGMPLVWLGRARGHGLRRRAYGPDLLLDFCRATHQRGYRHFFFGGAQGVPERLAQELKNRFPMLRVVGTYAPRFRPFRQQEDAQVFEMINQAGPDVLWVGLGCPKQERWMYEHRECWNVPVMVGVGAAFDFLTGRVRQAPGWMREHGTEWLFRLGQEPKRLWRRYLVYNTRFICYLCLEAVGLKRFE